MHSNIYVINNETQYVSLLCLSSSYMTFTSSFILDKFLEKNTIKSRFSIQILNNLNIDKRMELNLKFLSILSVLLYRPPALMNHFLVNMFPNIKAPKVPSNIPRKHLLVFLFHVLLFC